MASLPQDPAHLEKKKSPSVLRFIIAGSTAGTIGSAFTYPTELAKTRPQLNGRRAEG